MTELRQKVIRAMELKNLASHTQRANLAVVGTIDNSRLQSPRDDQGLSAVF